MLTWNVALTESIHPGIRPLICSATWTSAGIRTATSTTTDVTTTRKTRPVAAPRFHPRLALKTVTAGSIAMLRKAAITSALTSPRARSRQSTTIVIPRPIQITRQIV